MDWYFQDLSKSKQFSGIGKEQIAILVEELVVLQLENKCKVCSLGALFFFLIKKRTFIIKCRFHLCGPLFMVWIRMWEKISFILLRIGSTIIFQ